jgi:hypothetical protein
MSHQKEQGVNSKFDVSISSVQLLDLNVNFLHTGNFTFGLLGRFVAYLEA